MADNDSKIAQFIAVTGADGKEAKSFLESASWDVERAIGSYLEVGTAMAGEAAATSSPANEDVRAPDQAYSMVLSDGPSNAPIMGTGAGSSGLSNVFRDISREYSGAPGIPPAPYQRGAPISLGAGSSKKGLADLFAPPTDLIFAGTFDQAKSHASATSKWLLLNIQKASEFASQALNRDVWANDTVRAIIQSTFVFIQVEDSSTAGQLLLGLYPTFKFPSVMAIDPVTGARLQTWDGFLDAPTVIDHLTTFTDVNKMPDAAPLASKPSAPIPPASPSSLTEDEAMAMAMAASLEAAAGGGAGAAGSPTPPPPPRSASTSGSRSSATPAPPAPPKIDLSKIKVADEPPEGAEKTTRLQLRDVNGARITRRFYTSDKVQTVKDFMMVATGADKDVVVFMPPSRTPLDLNKTLSEVGAIGAVIAMRFAES